MCVAISDVVLPHMSRLQTCCVVFSCSFLSLVSVFRLLLSSCRVSFPAPWTRKPAGCQGQYIYSHTSASRLAHTTAFLYQSLQPGGFRAPLKASGPQRFSVLQAAGLFSRVELEKIHILLSIGTAHCWCLSIQLRFADCTDLNNRGEGLDIIYLEIDWSCSLLGFVYSVSLRGLHGPDQQGGKG